MTLIIPKSIALDDLDTIPVPKDTETYKAVPHKVLVEKLTDIFSSSHIITKTQFGLAKKGQQLFGVMELRNNNGSEFSYAIGFRNSYDKSLALGLVGGTRVFVCSNLCFSGDVKYLRKHTSGLDLDVSINEIAKDMPSRSQQFIDRMQLLQKDILLLDQRKALLFDVAANNIVPFSHLPRLNDEIQNGELFKDHKDNKFGLYMAVTDYLKKYSMPIQSQRLHSLATLLSI